MSTSVNGEVALQRRPEASGLHPDVADEPDGPSKASLNVLRLVRRCTFATVLFVAAVSVVNASDPSRGRLEGVVTGLRSTKGMLLCSLWVSPDGFPRDQSKAFRRYETAIHGATEKCVFEDVPTGTYAISFLHDENNNKKMDTNLFGKPTEGYGTSRDARGGIGGPPKFDDAKFDFHGESSSVTMKVAY